MLPFIQMIVVSDIDFSLIDSEREKMPIAKVSSKSNFFFFSFFFKKKSHG